MQYFFDRLSYQNKYNLLLFLKSVVQLDTYILKFKLHKISAVKFKDGNPSETFNELIDPISVSPSIQLDSDLNYNINYRF